MLREPTDIPITHFQFDEIDSTNQYLLSLPGLRSNMVCTANAQTHGRGRHGKTWYSPKQENLYLSLSYQLPEDPQHWSGLSCAVGLLLCESLRRHDYPVTIKWPNDILLMGKKCAGILIEVKNNIAVIGIGLNICSADFPDNLAQPAISLQVYDNAHGRTSVFPSNAHLVNEIIQTIYSGLIDFTGVGFTAYQNRWDLYDHYYAKQVCIHKDNRVMLGINQGVNCVGELLFLSDETGEQIQLCSANLSMRAVDQGIQK